MKTLTTIAAALTLVLSGITVSLFSTPCATEDSTLCYWDSTTRGNGQGHSYLSLTETLSIRTR